MSATPEVIVVGAGVIGCACAHELALAGARVSMFDVRRVGQGASQASAGVLAPYIEGHRAGPLRDLGRRSLDLFDDFVRSVVSSSRLTVQYTRNGTLEVGLEAEEADRLRASADTLRAEGIDARWLDPTELSLAEPLAATGARGALLIAPHGTIGVPEFTEALAASAMRHGATFVSDTRVSSIGPGPGRRVTVETNTGASRADFVVLAAGSWTGQVRIEGVEPLAIKPVRGQLLHLSWPTSQPLRHVIWGAECYLVPWLSGRVLVGATVEDAGFDERATAAGVRDLLEGGCSLVPQLWQASFTEVRVGLRPASPDALPVVGYSSVVPGLIYATGHYRNGVLLSPLTAALVKDLVFGSGADPALTLLSPSRFGTL